MTGNNLGAITKSMVEDAVDHTNTFLQVERGADLDGDFASGQIQGRVLSVGDRAAALLRDRPFPVRDGFYIPLSKYNAAQYGEAATVLPGHFVLVASNLVTPGSSAFYPAVVSEDGLKTGDIRLHIYKRPYQQTLRYGASLLLSAAGQSETKGVGKSGEADGGALEAEHFTTILAGSNDPAVLAGWQTGNHVNHGWRESRSTSVTTEASRRLFSAEMQQATVTITRRQIELGQAALLWHEEMVDVSGNPETATRDKALVVVQSLGYEALRSNNPAAIDIVKRLIA